jgi:hypothetical protein
MDALLLLWRSNCAIKESKQLIYDMNILSRLKKKLVVFTFWTCLISFFMITLLRGRDTYNSENLLLIAALCLIEHRLSKD